jgi:competence protein ComEC
MKRPLGIVAVLYAGGVLLGNYVPLPLFCLSAISVAVAAGVLFLPRIRVCFLWALLFFIGWTNFTWHTAILSPTDLRVVLTDEAELATLRGTLAETPTQRVYLTDEGETLRTMARLNVTAILGAPALVAPEHREGGSRRLGVTWQPASGQIMVITPGEIPENFCEHQEVQIYGVISPPPLPLAEGLFDYRTYLRRQEIYFQLKTQSSNDWQSVGMKVAPPFHDRFAKWAKASLAIGRTIIDTPLRLEQALSLGDKTFLTDDITEPFMQASTYHIFAVDGLRLAILSYIFLKSLRWLRVPRTISGFILILLLWFYVELTAWPPSAIRAAVMLSIVIFGWALKRPVDVLNSLCAAALLILLWQPQQLFQAGFQLSFCVVFCIFLVMPWFDKCVQRLLRSDPMLPDKLRPHSQITLLKPVRWILDLFFSSLAAWIGSIPLAAYYFHLFTPVSAPANVLAVILCAGVLVCNSLALLFAAWLPMGATLFNFLGWHFMHWIHLSSIWFAHQPCAYCYVPIPNRFHILVYYAVFIAAVTGWLFKPEWRKCKSAALCLLVAICCGQWLHDRSFTYVTVLPLNGGSAIYFDARGSRNDLLVDCGSEDSVNFVMKPFLRAQGVNSLPGVTLTVGDIRQVGGFEKLQTLFPVKKVITSSLQFRSPAYREIVQALEATPDLRQIVNRGDQIQNWFALHPVATNHTVRADDNALMLRGEFQGTRILLLSTLAKSGQDALLESHIDLRADIVIGGLPGQSEPLDEALLDSIHPELIIIADSQSPATRRANRSLRERLQKRGVPVVYTSDLGAAKISLQQNRWKVESINGSSWFGTPESPGSQ